MIKTINFDIYKTFGIPDGLKDKNGLSALLYRSIIADSGRYIWSCNSISKVFCLDEKF